MEGKPTGVRAGTRAVAVSGGSGASPRGLGRRPGRNGRTAFVTWGRREQVEPDDVDQRGHPVPPADLLSLLVGASGIGDGHLPDSRLSLCQAGSHLGLEPEPVAG